MRYAIETGDNSLEMFPQSSQGWPREGREEEEVVVVVEV